MPGRVLLAELEPHVLLDVQPLVLARVRDLQRAVRGGRRAGMAREDIVIEYLGGNVPDKPDVDNRVNVVVMPTRHADGDPAGLANHRYFVSDPLVEARTKGYWRPGVEVLGLILVDVLWRPEGAIELGLDVRSSSDVAI